VVTIIQGTIVLAVVVANEIAGRITRRAAERASRQSSGPPLEDSMTTRQVPGVVPEGTP
jgi:general nucleoside transport system permease protein